MPHIVVIPLLNLLKFKVPRVKKKKKKEAYHIFIYVKKFRPSRRLRISQQLLMRSKPNLCIFITLSLHVS